MTGIEQRITVEIAARAERFWEMLTDVDMVRRATRDREWSSTTFRIGPRAKRTGRVRGLREIAGLLD